MKRRLAPGPGRAAAVQDGTSTLIRCHLPDLGHGDFRNYNDPHPNLTGERHKEGALGLVAPGAYADLLLVDGNPLANIHLLEDPDTNLKLIMKDGVIYKNTLD